MLDKRLVAEAVARLENPIKPTPEQQRVLIASMVAESLKLEGIDTSTEDVLAAVKSVESEQARGVA